MNPRGDFFFNLVSILGRCHALMLLSLPFSSLYKWEGWEQMFNNNHYSYYLVIRQDLPPLYTSTTTTTAALLNSHVALREGGLLFT